MNFRHIAIPFIVYLNSCQTKDEPVDLSKEFNPYLHGTWVSSEYIDEVVKTRSPFASSAKMTYISEFTIDTAGINGDSLFIPSGLGNHEGFDFILHFKKGQTPTSLPTNIEDFENKTGSYEIGYTTSNSDTFLILYHYNNNKLLDKTKYIKVYESSSADNSGEGLQYIVNAKLMTGFYKATDTTGSETIVKMTNDGKISGLAGFKTYYILTDFVASSENVTDEICFDIQTKNKKCYGFEFKGDTIRLFEPAKDELDTLFKPGPSIYKFAKQH